MGAEARQEIVRCKETGRGCFLTSLLSSMVADGSYTSTSRSSRPASGSYSNCANCCPRQPRSHRRPSSSVHAADSSVTEAGHGRMNAVTSSYDRNPARSDTTEQPLEACAEGTDRLCGVDSILMTDNNCSLRGSQRLPELLHELLALCKDEAGQFALRREGSH